MHHRKKPVSFRLSVATLLDLNYLNAFLRFADRTQSLETAVQVFLQSVKETFNHLPGYFDASEWNFLAYAIRGFQWRRDFDHLGHALEAVITRRGISEQSTAKKWFKRDAVARVESLGRKIAALDHLSIWAMLRAIGDYHQRQARGDEGSKEWWKGMFAVKITDSPEVDLEARLLSNWETREPWTTTDSDSHREWLHPDPLRYYLRADDSGMWNVCDRWTDLPACKSAKSRQAVIRNFYRAVGRRVPPGQRLAEPPK